MIKRIKHTAIHPILVCIVVYIAYGCNPSDYKESNNADLSFGGIVIGKAFPDSLIQRNQFSYDESWFPSYVGKIPFIFAWSRRGTLDVQVYVESEHSIVHKINIYPTTYANISDLYDMLKAKYGQPSSISDKEDCKFYQLLDDAYKKGKEYEMPDEYGIGHQILCEWNPKGYRSKIQIVNYESDYSKSRVNGIVLKYIDAAATKTYNQEYLNIKNEEKKQNKRKQQEQIREKYIEENSASMKQDF